MSPAVTHTKPPSYVSVSLCGLSPSMMSLPHWYECDYHVIMDHARLISAGKDNSNNYISFLQLHNLCE